MKGPRPGAEAVVEPTEQVWGTYLQQHPGDAGEGRAHLQEQRDHGQVVAGLEVDR